MKTSCEQFALHNFSSVFAGMVLDCGGPPASKTISKPDKQGTLAPISTVLGQGPLTIMIVQIIHHGRLIDGAAE